MNDLPENGAYPQRTPLRPGQTIGGRYRILGMLGRGGMGIVCSAVHELTQRHVALKVVDSDGSDVKGLRDRFLSEARTAAAVRHPNIVDILDMGMHLGSPYLVMELLEGRSLDAVLCEGELSLSESLGFLLPIMGALSTLHLRGIVHRDVKPSNIFLSQVNRSITPKLLDFGLARAASDTRITRSGVVIGTPVYMAPEHAAGSDVGPAADVWSMGVVLYECIAGTLPFTSEDRSAQAAQVLAGHVRPIRQAKPDVPSGIAKAIDAALQRELGRRHSSMKAFVRALVDGAVADGVALPLAPDALGLPEFERWLSNARARPRVEARDLATLEVEAAATPARSNDVAPAPSGDEARRARVKGHRQRPLYALAIAVAVAVTAWWLWSRTDVSAPAEQAPLVTPGAAPERGPARVRDEAAPQFDVTPIVAPLTPSEDAGARADEPAGSARGLQETAPKRLERERRRRVRPAARMQAPSEVETEWK